uniref:TraB family protein n=1 Tax=Chenopodium quinoa TaxID=63459 RepID=A0A803MY64_CHEQI
MSYLKGGSLLDLLRDFLNFEILSIDLHGSWLYKKSGLEQGQENNLDANGRSGMIMGAWLPIQRSKVSYMVADKLEVLPGSEFRVAFEEAMKLGSRVVLGDRPVQLKEMDDVDMLTFVIQEMSKEFPTLMETLVNERDLYMSSTLLRIARENTSVVAVVGKGHLQGIKRNWEQPVEVSDLMEIPTSRPFLSAVKVLTTVGVAVAGAAIVSGIYLASKKQS